ncbi:MAG TPA: TrmH family RNA methyltransferase [Fimbriimonadaceae bacterium]|nr:TrmH family RNA methyltransferase [Fimbriimonadaceae bacterium]
MRLIGWQERQRRMKAALGEAWETAGHVPEDPGLRDRYGDLPRAPIRLICCPLIKDVNHGGLLRIAEAFRIERVDFAPEADRAVDLSGQRGTANYQPHRWIEPEAAIAEAKAGGCEVVALTLTTGSIPLEKVEWRFPLAVVLGSENEGVPPEILELCDAAVAIPLYGLVTSLNVSTAAAIVVHNAVQAYRAGADFEPARVVSRQLLA